MGEMTSPKAPPKSKRELKHVSETIPPAESILVRLMALPPSPPLAVMDTGKVRTVAEGEPNVQRHKENDSITFVHHNGQRLSTNVRECSAVPTGSFFVRECYVDNYERMMLEFDYGRIRGVTVSGTSGVGTSVFMAYFFLRYQLEHPRNTFVLISFDKDSVVQQAVMWKNGESSGLPIAHGLIDIEMQFSDDPNAIFLFDGPPNRRLVVRHRYVVFTSFNAKWLSQNQTNKSHRRLYMPLWDVRELKSAVEALGLESELGRMKEVKEFPRGADDRYTDEVAYRFDVFGGVASACLETDASNLATKLEKLRKATAVVNVQTGKVPMGYVDRHNESFKESIDKELHPRLYHWHPAISGYSYDLKIASPFVAKLLSARVDALNDNDKTRLEWGVNWCPEASALRQAMLKNKLLSLIKDGGSVVANALAFAADSHVYDLKLTIKPNSPMTRLLSSEFELKDPTGASWFIPQCNAFQSIDAFYLINPCPCYYDEEREMEIKNEGASGLLGDNIDAVVFHVMGMSDDHVNGQELYDLITQFECPCAQRPRVALVYVVPAARTDDFTLKSIDVGIGLYNSFPLTVIDGISEEMSQALKAANIHTVGDLRRQSSDATLTPEQLQVYKEAAVMLREHENNAVVTDSETHKQLQAIPQFVWGL